MKIPDDVFEKRCPYCLHGRIENGNRDVPDRLLLTLAGHDMSSCNIFGISNYKCREIPGECLDFMPHAIYGICYTCEFSNSFHPGYCLRDEQPNKRKLYIGCGFSGGAAHPDYWRDHILSTCDNYLVDHDKISMIRKQAIEGKIPRNFDPETMKPIGPAEKNEVAERWVEMERQEKEKRMAEEETAKKKRLALEAKDNEEQISLF